MYGKHVNGKMEFNQEEIKNGKLFNFLKALMDMHCEIRLWTDDLCYVVEYLEHFRKEDGEEFIVNEEVQCEEEEEEISSEEKLFNELKEEELEDYIQNWGKTPPQVIKVPHQTTLDTTTQDVLDSIENNEID